MLRKIIRFAGFFVLPYRDRTGYKHWINQRLTAIAMLPLYAWLLLTALPAASVAQYAELLLWMQNPANALLLYFTIVFSLHHMVLGLETMIQDYIATPALNALALFFVSWGTFLFMLAVLAAMFRILWQS